MTLEDRMEIQECLSHGMTFKAIAARIGKDPTTVSKEVKKHLTIKDGKSELEPCRKLLRAPFVCNGCKQRRVCRAGKQYYYAPSAQNEYAALLSECREGVALNKQAFWDANSVLTSGIKKGQRLYHIMQSQDIGISKSSVYRYVQRGYMDVAKLDFPRIVKFKPRRGRPAEYIPKRLKIGRAYDDFQAFIESNEITSWVEMDTVIGEIGGKVIMTLHFTFCNFMLGLLLENKTAAEVSDKIRELKTKLQKANFSFGEIFPVILTDNGGEFSDVFAFENDARGAKECSLFFCDPMQSCQKGKIEKNHTLFRDIVPKGKSFDDFSQETVNLIFSHVNSIRRKVLHGKSPYELFAYTFGEKLTETLGISSIPDNDVIQSPKLLK